MVTVYSGARAGIGNDLQCDRRALLVGAGAGVLALALPGDAAALPNGKGGTGQIAFFGDRPMKDPSGTLPPYYPPKGFGKGKILAGADEKRMRYLTPFMV